MLIDLDHFLLARLHAGDWRALRAVVAEPSLAFRHQDRIFAPGEVGTLRRLLSHHLLGGALVGALAIPAPFWATLSGIVVYAHVVADLAWDVWRRDAPV